MIEKYLVMCGDTVCVVLTGRRFDREILGTGERYRPSHASSKNWKVSISLSHKISTLRSKEMFYLMTH